MHHTPFLHDGLHLNLARTNGACPVVFQHGLCGSALQTREVFPDDPRFALHTLECRGHGASEAGPESAFGISRFADDVAAMILAHMTPPVVVGGISMGAAIALRLAVTRPDLVKALVLARPAWTTAPSPPNMAPNREVGELLRARPPRQALDRFLAGHTAASLRLNAPDNLASLSSFFTREPIAVTSALLCAISADGPAVAASDLKALALPALILATEQDAIHPLALAEELQALIPHARLRRLTPKGVDKQAHVAEFREALLSFLEEFA